MKITTKKFKSTLLLASAITLGSFSSLHAAQPEGLELLKNIGTYQGELNTYYMQKPSAEELRNLLNISTKMNAATGAELAYEQPVMVGETVQQFRGLKDSSALFEIDSQTGHFLFNGGMDKYRDEQSTKALPEDRTAVKYAYYMLSQYGLEVDPAQLKVGHVGGLNMAIPDGKGGSTIFEKLKTVRFNRTLDGLPVEGSARIVINMGERAGLSGMVYQWSKVGESVALEKSQLRSPESMRYQALRKIEQMSKKAQTARLTRVALVLYDDGRGVVEPAYHIVLERDLDLGDEKPVMIPYDFYVPVAEKPQAFFPQFEIAHVKPEQGAFVDANQYGKDE